VIAGQQGANHLHAATISDGGEHRRIEARNRSILEEAERVEIEAHGEFTEPDWREVVSPDGVRCLVTRGAEPPSS
jgi:hypothetical protein